MTTATPVLSRYVLVPRADARTERDAKVRRFTLARQRLAASRGDSRDARFAHLKRTYD